MGNLRARSIAVAAAAVCALCLTAAVPGSVGLLASPASAAAPEFTFRLADDGAGPGQPLTDSAALFAAEVNQKSNGRIHVDQFTHSTLGSGPAIVQGVQNGSIDMGCTTMPNFVAIEPRLAVFTLPYLLRDNAQARRVANSKPAAQQIALLEAKGIKPLSIGTNGFLVLTVKDKAIERPSDLKGMRVRILPNQLDTATFSALGALPVPVEFAQVYLALRQGTVDAVELSLPAVYGTKLYEVAKHLTLTNHAWLPEIFVMNLKAFQSLPPDLQKVVESAAVDAGYASWGMQDAATTKLTELLKQNGMTISTIADTRPFRAAVEPVYQRFGPQVGNDVIAKIQAVR